MSVTMDDSRRSGLRQLFPVFWFFGCRRFSNFNGLWGGLRRFSGSLVVTRFSNYALEPLAFGDVSFVHVHAHH